MNATDTIVTTVMEKPRGLTVMDTHGHRGLQRVVLGSDSEKVLRRFPVPVVLVRPHG